MTMEERIKAMTKKQRLEHAISNALREYDGVFKKNGTVINVCKITSPNITLIAGYDVNRNTLDDSDLEMCASATFEGAVSLAAKLDNDDTFECTEKISSTFIDVKYNDGMFTGQISKYVSVK